MTEFEEPQMGNMPGEQSSYRCTICGGVVKFDGREGEFIDRNNSCGSYPRKPSKGALAAAHRAGAREANQAIIDELTQAGLEYGRISKWMTDEDRLDAKISRSVISEMLRRIERIKARYAEPEEEKKG